MSVRRLAAVFEEVEPISDPPALRLAFRPTGPRAPEERVEDRADLDAALSLESAMGIGKVLRLLRAARLVAPRDASVLLGDPERAAALLSRALGTAVMLDVRTRATVRFTAWTDQGVESIPDVADVMEDASGFLVRRRGHRLPVRIPRDQVVRQQTRTERWLEVVSIERPE